jgi:hypothetical protein
MCDPWERHSWWCTAGINLLIIIFSSTSIHVFGWCHWTTICELLLSVSLFCAALENKISMRFLPKEEARFFHYPHYTLLWINSTFMYDNDIMKLCIMMGRFWVGPASDFFHPRKDSRGTALPIVIAYCLYIET